MLLYHIVLNFLFNFYSVCCFYSNSYSIDSCVWAKNTVLLVSVKDIEMDVLIYMHKQSVPCVLCNCIHTHCYFYRLASHKLSFTWIWFPLCFIQLNQLDQCTNYHFRVFHATGLTETHISFECYATGSIVAFNFLHDHTNWYSYVFYAMAQTQISLCFIQLASYKLIFTCVLCNCIDRNDCFLVSHPFGFKDVFFLEYSSV